MNSFILLYLFYSAKLGSQATIYFIWLVDPSSETIAFIAAAVAIFAIFPFFHVIVHIFSAKPLSNPTFIAYLCFSSLLAVLWYEPTRDGEQRVLPFAVVTTFDLLALLIFLFQRQIGRWHDILTSDTREGHLRAGGIDDASITLMDPGNEQVEYRNVAARPEATRSEVLQGMQGLGVSAINRSEREVGADPIRPNPHSIDGRPSGQAFGRGIGTSMGRSEANGRFAGAESARWTAGMPQLVNEPQDVSDGSADLEVDPATASGIGTIHSLRSVGTPDTIILNDIHPAYRPTFDNTSQLVFHMPIEASSPKETMFERNQI